MAQERYLIWSVQPTEAGGWEVGLAAGNDDLETAQALAKTLTQGTDILVALITDRRKVGGNGRLEHGYVSGMEAPIVTSDAAKRPKRTRTKAEQDAHAEALAQADETIAAALGPTPLATDDGDEGDEGYNVEGRVCAECGEPLPPQSESQLCGDCIVSRAEEDGAVEAVAVAVPTAVAVAAAAGAPEEEEDEF